MTIDKGGEIQTPCHAKDVESKEATAEKDVSIKGVKLDKQEKDISEAMIPVSNRKKRRKSHPLRNALNF